MASSIRGIVSGNTNVAEISPALANFNFDFTLCRVEAPTEFHGVGRALTHGRRTEAESGQSHITARILGALFTSALPKTPNLIRIYGARASEISKSAAEESSKTQSWGFFADHSGADGTTIWASATSGPESIPMHLLACLLARAWDPPEAISIWEQIVRRRREIILADFDNSNIADIRDVWAAKHPLSRDHLAEWDNSARSWLRTADRVKEREQKQVMLIFDNIEQQIRSDQGTYESVLSAWQEALNFFEAIVSGISQRAGSGQSLLALCAWHLYPELMVVDPSPGQTKQNDALMPAKVIVTIGLGQKSGQRDGICWSLPLAYFRHYGPAVKRESVVNSTQRLSVEEFEMVFFGTFIVGWTKLGVDVVQIAHWLRRVHQILLQKSGTKSPAGEFLKACQRFTWLGILFESSNRYLTPVHSRNNCDRQLVRLGQVDGQSFLGEKGDPFFGLCSAGAYMDCFKAEEESIAHLRAIASNLPGDASSMFIRLRHTCHDIKSGAIFEYLSAKPISRRCTKRDSNGSQLVISKHCRWMYNGGDLSKHTKEKCYILRLLKTFPQQFDDIWPQPDRGPAEAVDLRQTFADPVGECFLRIDRDSSGWADESRPYLNTEMSPAATVVSIGSDFQRRQSICNAMGEDVQLREDHVIEDYHSERLGVFWTTYSDPPLPSKSCWYRQVYGSNSAAIFVLESALEINTSIMETISIPRFLGLFDTDLVDPDKLATLLLSSVYHKMNTKRVVSLKAVSTAANIYRTLSNATIDIRVIQHNLSKMRWMTQATYPPSSLGLFLPAVLNLPSIFSCICFFESGRFNIEISALQNVMAMSTGDNIWVAYPLLNDPYSSLQKFDDDSTGDDDLTDDDYQSDIQTINSRVPDVPRPSVIAFTGNVGRPGISFLVPPKEPMIRSRSIYDFRQILHEPFDGNVGNDFHDTSLHLSFTSAKSNIPGYFEGLKDSELEVVETALSVYERDKWVADLDVVKSMAIGSLAQVPPCPECQQEKNGKMAQKGLLGENIPGVTAITNWTELLDPPETILSVVKASGNWEARLAAYVIAVASEYHGCVLPDAWCWTCVGNSMMPSTEKRILIA